MNKDPSIFEELKGLRTKSGVSFAKVIKPGMDNKGHPMIKTAGVVAGDEESYTLFSRMLDPVIAMRHLGFGGDAKHVTDLNPAKVDPDKVDATGKYIMSTQLRMTRNLRGFKLPSACSFDE